MLIYRSLLIILLSLPLSASEWSTHRQNIKNIETQIIQLETELEDKVEKKKSTKNQARVEENLQRIVEIHSELISLRKDLSNEIQHTKLDHADKASLSSVQESKKRLESSNKRFSMNPLNLKLDQLIRKIQSKFASFIEEAEDSEELVEVEEMIKQKKLKRKEKESQIYLRKKSKVKLVK